MAFKLTKYSYKALRQLSIQDRMQMAQDREMGQWLLSLLTPTQFVDLFPRYYRERLPDISGFMAAVPSSMSAAKQRAVEEQLNNTTSGAKAGSNYKAGGWKERYQKDMDNQRRASVSKAGTVPPPQLSPEQRKSFEDLKSAPMAADDPRAKMFAGLSAEQMAKVGISKVKENGKDVFKYTAPTVSEEEAKQYISSQGSLGSASRKYESGNRGVAMISSGVGDAGGKSYGSHQLASAGGNASTMAAFLRSAEGAAYASHFSGLTPGSEAFGDVYKRIAANDPKGFDAAQHAFITRTHYEPVKNFAANNGYNINDRRVQEALFSMGVQHREAKAIVANAGNGAGKTPEEQVRALFNARRSYVDKLGLSYLKSRYANEERDILGVSSDPITQDYSEKNLQLAREKVARRKEEERIGSLAQYTTAQPNAVEQAALSSSGSKASEALINRFNGRTDFKNNKGNHECATFAQAHGVGHTSGWSAGSSLMGGGMKPGDWIALFQDGKYTNKSGSAHTAMFVGYERDANGNITGVKVLDQWNGRKQVGVSTWHPGSGGEMDPNKYHQIIDRGKPASMYNSVAELDGQPSSPQPPQPKLDSKQLTETQAAPTSQEEVSAAKRRGELSPPVPVAGPQGDNTPQVSNPREMKDGKPAAPVAAAPATPSPERYRVDTSKFINAIKQTSDFKSNPLSWMATDSMIVNGFNDDARVKAAGVFLDQNGVMHFKQGMTPEVKQVMADFDTKSFMTKMDEEKKKADVKPVEQKPVADAPPVPRANPHGDASVPQKSNPKEVAQAQEVKPAPLVKTNALGGTNKINTEEIYAYPIGGLKGDNAVVVNKAQKPLFTMNTNESMTIDPKNDTATVTPNKKDGNVGNSKHDPMQGMFDQFNDSIKQLANRFDENKSVSYPKPPERFDPFPPETGIALGELNKLTATQFHSPSAARAFSRSGAVGQEQPNNSHFTHGNHS